MNADVDVLARLISHRLGRAFPLRKTFALDHDPHRVFAMAPVKMVSEEIVQALAYGCPDAEPGILVRVHPLSRDTSALEPFAVALGEYVRAVRADDKMPRFWLPHGSALVVVELLGHRYRTNKSASPALRRMGEICQAIAVEARYAGQQVVAIAGALLREHVATGQASIKDGHLGALLAWVDPLTGVDPTVEADRRALIPASGVLERRDDDMVEVLRKTAKRGGPRGKAAVHEIERILEKGARAEWRLLLQARQAFWRLPMLPVDDIDHLTAASKRRTEWTFAHSISAPVQPHSLSRELVTHEFAHDQRADVDVRGDTNLRERARHRGRAVRAEVLRIDQPKKSRKPCDVTLRTTQETLRLRTGSKLQTLNRCVVGQVIDVSEDSTGATLVRLALTKGVRKSDLPQVGTIGDWVDSVLFESPEFMQDKMFKAMKTAASPLVYARNLIGAKPRQASADDILKIAEGYRR